jgi:hypothetical protein
MIVFVNVILGMEPPGLLMASESLVPPVFFKKKVQLFALNARYPVPPEDETNPVVAALARIS